MIEPQVFIEVDLKDLLDKTNEYKDKGWRLTNLCGSTVEDGKVELLYSFASGLELENLVVLVANGDKVPAVSPMYPCMFVFENETHDLFGVDFEGITIDFGGRFYSTSVPTPMNPAASAAKQYLSDNKASEGNSAAKKDDAAAPEESTVEEEGANG